jgi:H+/Cl- antiporter ClcA
MLKNLSSYFSLKTAKINYFFIENLYYLKCFFQKIFFAFKMKKKFFVILKYLKNNFFILFFTLIFIVLISLFVNELIKIYCSSFYIFGEFAKSRIIENPAFAFIITPILFWVSGLICKKISFNINGNGLDNITLAIKKLKVVPFSYKFVANYIGFKTILVIIFSSLISTYGGGSLGREAPSIFISVSIIFSFAYFLRKFLVKIALENWIYLGYALGIFIAFNAPIAGMIYVAEKLIINKAKYYKTSFFIAFTSILGLYFSVYEYHSVYPNFLILFLQTQILTN